MDHPKSERKKQGVPLPKLIVREAVAPAFRSVDVAMSRPVTRPYSRRRRMRGLTLVELMVTLAVGVILLSASVPGFSSLVMNSQLRSQINELVMALNLARHEAVKRNRTVSVCQSSDGASCGGTDKHWEQGWIVFVNSDADSPAVVDTGEEVLRRAAPSDSGYTLRTDASYANFVSYHPTGQAHAPGRFVLCKDSDRALSRALFVNTTGHAYLGQDGNHNDIPEDDDGNDVTTCNP